MKRLKIGPISYEIVMIDDMDKIGDNIGSIQYNTSRINLDRGLSPQASKQVLWHEAIHGILTHAKVDHTEQLMEVLSYGIMQLLQDNPEMKE